MRQIRDISYTIDREILAPPYDKVFLTSISEAVTIEELILDYGIYGTIIIEIKVCDQDWNYSQVSRLGNK